MRLGGGGGSHWFRFASFCSALRTTVLSLTLMVVREVWVLVARRAIARCPWGPSHLMFASRHSKLLTTKLAITAYEMHNGQAREFIARNYSPKTSSSYWTRAFIRQGLSLLALIPKMEQGPLSEQG